MFGFGEKKTAVTREHMEAFFGNIKLLAEDLGWRKQGAGIFEDISNESRLDLVQRSREAYVKHPSYRRVVSLNKAFVLGKGVNRPTHENPIIQYAIDKVWSAPENECTFTGEQALETQIEQRDIAGEIFYKIYVDTATGLCTVRVETDMFAVKNVVTDPEDKAKIIAYEYCIKENKYDPKVKGYVDGQEKTYYIPHIYNSGVMPSDYPEIPTNGTTKVFGYLAVFSSAGMKEQRRGMPFYYQILPWLKAHREVCEDAASFLKALAKFAWKKKFKNIGKETMDGIVALAQTFNPAGNLNKTPTATASTLVENGNVENETLEIKQNPEVFVRIADLLLQQVASGADKMKHYFANPENANLATATSMELPMLKDFQRQQKVLLSILTKVLSFCVLQYLKVNTADVLMEQLDRAGYVYNEEKTEEYKEQLEGLSYSNIGISAYAPKIIDKNLQQTVNAIIAALNAGAITDKDASYQIYELFEYDNVDEIVAELFGDDGHGTLGGGMDQGAADLYAQGVEDETQK